MVFAPARRPSAGARCLQLAAHAAARSSPPDRTDLPLGRPTVAQTRGRREWSPDALREDGQPEPVVGPLGRLTKRAEFLRVARGRRVPVDTFTLQSRRREAPESETSSGPRVGVTVTKSVGGAVVRNRVRRRLKEALRAATPLEARG